MDNKIINIGTREVGFIFLGMPVGALIGTYLGFGLPTFLVWISGIVSVLVGLYLVLMRKS